ncbi:MAG: 3-oxoadipate enol-lactonase [Myxococcales bacterium]
MPTIAIDGAELHYQDTGGPGEPVVFSHGLFWSGRMYDAQIAALRGRYRCVAYDHRGQGGSAAGARAYDMETLATDAAALIRALDLGPCHFVGLSMGGFVGMRLAARTPALVRSLILLETAADAEPFWSKPRYALLALAARTLGMPRVVGEVMKAMFGRSFLADPARAGARDEMRARLLANGLDDSLRALRAVTDRAPIEGELSAIRCPTLVLSGDEDRAVVPRRSRRTAGLIPGARFQSLPRAGHTATVEEPAVATAAIAAFLDSLPPRRA